MHSILNRGVRRRTIVGAVAATLLLPLALISTTGAGATTSTNPIDLTAPNIPGVAPLPGTGVTATAFTIGTSIGALVTTPEEGVEGTTMTISGSGLPDNTTVQLDWSTSAVTWVADVEPDTVNYLGTTTKGFNVVLGSVTTNASGAFSYPLNVPSDFGGLHTIYAVVNNVELAQGGFTILRTLTISPKRGPVGTPITITYTGMGASLYTGGASVLWDNHYVGEMMANWTRGTASITIRAAGSVGAHFIQVGNAISYMYLNVIQSPIPYTNGGTFDFAVTKGKASLTPFITWPAQVAPTVSEITTLATAGLDPASNGVGSLSVTSGPVLTPDTLTVTGLPTGQTTDQLVWATVIGNRVNCTSTCWAFSYTAMGNATATNGRISQKITIPDGLGGWHVLQVMNGSNIEAQVPYYVKESIVPFYNAAGKLLSMGVATANDSDSAAALAAGQSGTGTYTFHENQEFTISINGVGWTQLDNTLGVDYDNSYMGYGCGFNSNGYMVIHMHATGGLGYHVIDLYPMLYSLSPSFASTPYGMVPILSAGRDYPGLALGYQVPSIHFIIDVVK